MPAPRASKLTVAVTGPTGTFGHGLIPLLEEDDRVGRIVGLARRPFDPVGRGWTKLDYRQGDVREPDVLAEAFEGADVVVHLAFMITGNAPRGTIREINVDGTQNTFRAAAEAGARRFVYASSVAAYGFHRDNPVPMTEDWPARPAAHLFYAREKAEIERLLRDAAAEAPGMDLYMLRPPIVLGPHAVGAKDLFPGPSAALLGRLLDVVRATPLPVPVLVPEVRAQFIHEDDVGRALALCVTGAGPPGTYNIAGDGVLTAGDVARELGLTPMRIPARPAQVVARGLAALPLPPVGEWVEALSQPPLMDCGRAKRELGWRPVYTGLEALRDTLRRGP